MTGKVSIADAAALIEPLGAYLNETWPGQTTVISNYTAYSRFYDWWGVNQAAVDQGTGTDIVVASRLLDGHALSDVSALSSTVGAAVPPGNLANLNLVGGKGVWEALPAGGSDSVSPAWRTAYVEWGKPPRILLEVRILTNSLFQSPWLRGPLSTKRKKRRNWTTSEILLFRR